MLDPSRIRHTKDQADGKVEEWMWRQPAVMVEIPGREKGRERVRQRRMGDVRGKKGNSWKSVANKDKSGKARFLISQQNIVNDDGAATNKAKRRAEFGFKAERETAKEVQSGLEVGSGAEGVERRSLEG